MTERITMEEVQRMMDPPRARKKDPVTSHLAVKELLESGRHLTKKMQVLLAVKKTPGKTAHEIMYAHGFSEIGIPQKSLSSLKNDGLVYTGDSRTCKIRGSECLTWYPSEELEE